MDEEEEEETTGGGGGRANWVADEMEGRRGPHVGTGHHSLVRYKIKVGETGKVRRCTSPSTRVYSADAL